MISTPTVLVLGAGASKPYGFPLGGELRGRIIGMAAGTDNVTAKAGLAADPHLQPFVDAFARSRLYSIDAFLGIRSDFSDIGRRSIAAQLWYAEAESSLVDTIGTPDDWYDYLWNKLASGHSWDEVKFNNLSIVTFNYDRSLEVFLLRAATATFNVSESDAIAKLKTLRIEHVYGSLGSPWPGDADYFRYGWPVQAASVSLAAKSIRIIPEARDDEPVFKRAQEMLLAAHTICFLGFGFDSLNLRRLDAARTCGEAVFKGGDGTQTTRAFIASCMGRTPAEQGATPELAVGP
ncbi:MAG: SIR2 family protein [Burkholderiaceae bacterium]